jgi:hypothetical protein
MKPRLAVDLNGLETAIPVLEDLPQGELARELAEESLGHEAPRLGDGRWAIEAFVQDLRLFARGDDDTWEILRPQGSDESDACMMASKLHAAIGWRHSEWDADR